MKNFLEKTEEGLSIKFALNFHTWGNMLLYPFAYLNSDYTAKQILKLTDNELKDLLKDTLCFYTQDDTLYAYAKTQPDCKNLNKDTVSFDFRDAFTIYDHLANKAGLPKGS